MSSSAVVVEDPGGNGIPLDEVWVWVTVHGPGEESITGVDGLPLVAQQRALAERVRPLVERAARVSGKAQRLVRLTRVGVVDEVPGG